MLHLFKPRTISLAICLAFGLAACGGSGSSSSTPGPVPVASSSSGVVVDDLIIGATVLCDLNNNGTLDDNEATTTTGADGGYTFSPACDAPIVALAGEGYDKTTLKTLKAAFRAAARSAIVSPFTTMQVGSGLSAEQFKAVMAKLGLGESDVRNYHPTEAQTALAAAAVAKLLNDIAAAIEAAGGNAEVAYAAAAVRITALVNASTSAAPLDDDVTLSSIISDALGAALDTVPASANLTQARRDNLTRIALAGIKTIVKSIKSRGSLHDADDDFRSDKVRNVLDDTDLDDKDASDRAEEACRDNGNNVQYVYSAGNQVTLQTGQVEQSFNLTQFRAGANLTGLTLGNLDRIGLPLRTTALGLSRRGTTVPLGIEVKEVGGTRKLQVVIDDVVLAAHPSIAGLVVATVPAGAKMSFYAISASGVSIETGNTPIVNQSANLISSGGVINVPVGVIRDHLAAGLGASAASTFDKMLAVKGSFDVTVVIGELDVREAPAGPTAADKLPVKTITVTNASNKGKGKVKSSVSGASVSGRLNFL
jgi:hypothetical protein